MRELLRVAIGCLVVASGTAHADRTMVVVLDATGSMQAVRGDGKTRFQEAQEEAAARVMNVATSGGGLSGVAVYRFFGTGIVAETAGFILPFDAATLITTLSVTSEVTPLAGSMCDTIDIARGSGSGATTTRFLDVYSDGAENNTDPLHACFGPFSVSNVAPFDAGSWQNKVYIRSTNPLPAVTITATLYHDVTLAFARAVNPETAKLAKLGRAAPGAAALADFATDADLFAAIAADTGGAFVEVIDSQPAPVIGDLDNDFDVDRNDAIIMARRFGAPAFHSFDLNDDNLITFDDYSLLTSRLGTGTGNPAPDPYVHANTIRCTGVVTIDGKVIESGGLTIETVGACVVFLRNSLIVSGQAAITVRGAAQLVVDNTIVVGQGAWLNSVGATTLSAANSVFHGAQQVTGSFIYRNRGGNTFER